MYSFSTCWNSHRHTDGRAMLREIRELGFEYAELSHGTRLSLLPGIIEAVEAGDIKISSLHNFCPLPMGVTHAAPNLYEFSSDRAREQELAERYTIKTLEFATRVKAPVVVTHVGSIEMKEYTDKMLGLVEKGDKDAPKYQKLCKEFMAKRDSKKKAYFDRTQASLKRVISEVEARGLKLGIENRQALEELPVESDYGALFQQIRSPNLVYWHDTGHAQIKENLGFIQHYQHLASLADNLAGFHIHDVQFPGKDHCAPGSGQIDFAALKPLIRPEHIKVFELSPSLKTEQVRAGIDFLKAIWGPV
jgi:sugar phosphate isomerase/epimerase